jgi:glycine cleavage system H protein
MRHYTDSHEWIDVNTGQVGITVHAQKELGEIVHIELPKIGQQVKMGEELAVLESTKAAADVYAPVGGKVIEVNEAVKRNLALLNEDPEKAGWLFRLEIGKKQELDYLLTEERYKLMLSS